MLKNKRRNSKFRFKNNPLWSKKILFYRLKYKFLIINYIYILHREEKRIFVTIKNDFA